MNKKEYFEQIWNHGKLICGYTELKIFDKITALVFARINTEYNYAVGHDCMIFDYFFGYSESEIAKSIDVSEEEVHKAIENFVELDFILLYTVQSVNLMHLNFESICDYINQAEEKNNYARWDKYLPSIQHAALATCEDLSELKNYVDELTRDHRYDLATDEFGNLLKY